MNLCVSLARVQEGASRNHGPLRSACYGLAAMLAVRLTASRSLSLGIFGAACLFRAVMLPSIPMYEIDVYRYIWDGAVCAEGVSY